MVRRSCVQATMTLLKTPQTRIPVEGSSVCDCIIDTDLAIHGSLRISIPLSSNIQPGANSAVWRFGDLDLASEIRMFDS